MFIVTSIIKKALENKLQWKLRLQEDVCVFVTFKGAENIVELK